MKNKLLSLAITIIPVLGLFLVSCACKPTTDKKAHENKPLLPKKQEKIDQQNNNQQKVAQPALNINLAQKIHDTLGENNKYLQEDIKKNKQDVLEVLEDLARPLEEFYTHKKIDGICKVCYETFTITHDKFHEIVEQCNFNGTVNQNLERPIPKIPVVFTAELRFWPTISNFYFLFKKCLACISEKDILAFHTGIAVKLDQLAKEEARWVKEHLALKEERRAARLQDAVILGRLLQRRLVLEEKIRQADEEKIRQADEKIKQANEELKQIQEKTSQADEKRKQAEEKIIQAEEKKKQAGEEIKQIQEESRQNKIIMAQELVDRGMPLDRVLQLTGLSEADLT